MDYSNCNEKNLIKNLEMTNDFKYIENKLLLQKLTQNFIMIRIYPYSDENYFKHLI